MTSVFFGNKLLVLNDKCIRWINMKFYFLNILMTKCYSVREMIKNYLSHTVTLGHQNN